MGVPLPRQGDFYFFIRVSIFFFFLHIKYQISLLGVGFMAQTNPLLFQLSNQPSHGPLVPLSYASEIWDVEVRRKKRKGDLTFIPEQRAASPERMAEGAFAHPVGGFAVSRGGGGGGRIVPPLFFLPRQKSVLYFSIGLGVHEIPQVIHGKYN